MWTLNTRVQVTPKGRYVRSLLPCIPTADMLNACAVCGIASIHADGPACFCGDCPKSLTLRPSAPPIEPTAQEARLIRERDAAQFAAVTFEETLRNSAPGAWARAEAAIAKFEREQAAKAESAEGGEERRNCTDCGVIRFRR